MICPDHSHLQTGSTFGATRAKGETRDQETAISKSETRKHSYAKKELLGRRANGKMRMHMGSYRRKTARDLATRGRVFQ